MGLQHLVNEVFINGSPNPFLITFIKTKSQWKLQTQGTWTITL